MIHSGLKKHTVLTWSSGQKGIFFCSFDGSFDFRSMVNFQEKAKNGLLPEQVFSPSLPGRQGEISMLGFSYKTGLREDAWFMGCFSAGAFFIRKGDLFLFEGEFYYQGESKGYWCRHFTVAPLQTFADREFLRLKYFAGGW